MPASSVPATTTLPELTLYLSLNCPYSALANYRASWLQATMRAHVDVRLVCRPEDEASRDVVGDLRWQLDGQVAEVNDLLVEGPVFPVRVPPRLPDVREATRRYAHHRTRDTRPRDRRVRLFRSLWLRGRDLSDLEVLDEVGVPGPGAPERAGVWQRAWGELGQANVPLLVTSAGEVLRSQDALHELLTLRTSPTMAASAR